jgi:hypothetical protein
MALDVMQPLRDQLARFVDWKEAHAGFDKAVADIPPDRRGVVPERLPYSIWQIVEHLRIAQADILEFCVSASYAEKAWPADYWPRSPRPSSDEAWTTSIDGFRRDRKAMQALALDPAVDLFARIPHGTGQTYLRELLVVADHTSYHVGQIVIARRALGIWPD